MASISRTILVALVLAAAMFPAATATLGYSTPSHHSNTVLEAAVATSTIVGVGPSSGSTDTVFTVSSRVSPDPGGGNMRLTAWTSVSGGSVLWDHTYPVRNNGIASVPSGVTLDPGTYWWQAQFLGTTGFLASTSPTRSRITVTGLTPTISATHITWADPGQDIQFGATGTAVGGGSGLIELVIDGSVHAECRSGDTCAAPNVLPPGPLEVFLRFVPDDPSHGTASGPTTTVNNGTSVPPTAGIVIEGGRFSVRHTSVTIFAANTESGEDVTGIRLSNSPVTAGGALVDGVDVGITKTQDVGIKADWTLADGVDGTRTVYAQLRTADSLSGVYSDAIVLDTAPPAGSITIDAGAANFGDMWGASVPDQEINGSVTDNSLASGGTISHVALSNNGTQYFVMPFTSDPASISLPWQPLADPYNNVNADGGLKTVYAMWEDEAGNWSAPMSDSIRYVGEDAPGNLKVDGDPAQVAPNPSYTAKTSVDLTITLDVLPPEGVASVRVAGSDEDGLSMPVAWGPSQTTATVPWSLTDSHYGYSADDGMRTIRILITTETGRLRQFDALVVVDRSIPLSTVPVPAFALDSQVSQTSPGTGLTSTSNTSALTELQWAGSAQAATYTLQRKQGSSWSSVTLPRPLTTLTTQSFSPGTTNQYRVRSSDSDGNPTSWQTSSPFSLSVVQENGSPISYSGSWKTSSINSALGGKLRSATAAGAFAKFTFTGRAFAWIAPRTGGASAAVYVDGKLLKTVLVGTTGDPRRVVFSVAWKSAGQHTVKIVKKYSTNTLQIDAFLVLV